MDDLEKNQVRQYANDYSDSKMLALKNLEQKRGLDIKEVMEKNTN